MCGGSGAILHGGHLPSSACCLEPLLRKVVTVQSARLGEAQAGVEIARTNTNNLKYADDKTLMAECEEGLKSLLLRVKKKSENLA